MSPKEIMTSFLIKELGSKNLVKDFVETYRVFGINVGDIRTINYLAENNEVFLSMISLYQFGVARKLADIIKKIKD